MTLLGPGTISLTSASRTQTLFMTTCITHLIWKQELNFKSKIQIESCGGKVTKVGRTENFLLQVRMGK